MDSFTVLVKANAAKDEIVSKGDLWKVSVAAPAMNGKANIKLVKFLSKELGRQVRIKSGLTSKKKIITFL